MATTYRSAADLVLERLASHEEAEASILEDYQRAAETARDPGVRFLMDMIIQDEQRHKAWMASLADSIREIERGGDGPVPGFEGHGDRALAEKTDRFIETERQTLEELKELRRIFGWVAEQDRHLYRGGELSPSPSTGVWAEHSPLPLVLEAMVQDTKRHVDILQAIRRQLRPG